MTRIRTGSLLALASGLFSFLALAAPLAAQSDASVVRGRVADADDTPLPDVVVVLHAVTDQAGVEVDRDTADAQGAFSLEYEPEEGALYFVATRVNGEIFMADPFREPPAEAVVLRAGAGVEPLRMDAFDGSQTAGPPAAGGPAPSDSHAGWWVGIIGAAILGLVAWLVHRGRHRAPRARELLVEIARLDESRAAVPDGAGSEDAYRTRREELRARLVEALELDQDADRH